MRSDLIQGNSLRIPLRDKSVQTCVTSPPYYGLRDYGVSGQLGLEPTHQEYMDNTVLWAREVRRVLRDDGTFWLNIGDSYNGSGGPGSQYDNKHAAGLKGTFKKYDNPNKKQMGFKPKDLMMVPHRIAIALQEDGWVIRSEIIWNKPNPMPESVTDRPTKSHEQIFMFSKGKRTPGIVPVSMTRENAMWLAALIDGEGSICFQENTSKRAKFPTFSVRLSISNTCIELLERAQEITGMRKPRHYDTSVNKKVYQWQLTNKKAASVIAAVYPYLIAKREQAILGMAMHVANQRHKTRNKPTTEKEYQYKKSISENCSNINRGREYDISFVKMPKISRWTSQPYYWDADAIREEKAPVTVQDPRGNEQGRRRDRQFPGGPSVGGTNLGGPTGGRNKRSVWTITTKPYPGAHFATFPPEIPEICIKAGTSEKGVCPVCGNGWVREVKTSGGTIGESWHNHQDDLGRGHRGGDQGNKAADLYKTYKREFVGWNPTCDHDEEPVPAIVLDPFSGSGTTIMVANALGRKGIGIDLSWDYLQLARERTGAKALDEWERGKQAESNLEGLPMFDLTKG